MGWISKRHMESGGRIGPGGLSERTKGAPLRKIVGRRSRALRQVQGGRPALIASALRPSRPAHADLPWRSTGCITLPC